MSCPLHKNNVLFAALAPIAPLLISAGILATSRKDSMPPTWFFLLQWILFALLLLLIRKKQQSSRPEPEAEEEKIIKHEEPETIEKEPEINPDEKTVPVHAQNGQPAPFIPSQVPEPEIEEAPTLEAEIPFIPEEKKEDAWMEAALIDSTIIKRHAILGEDFVRKLFDIFVEDSPLRLDEMESALTQNTFENLRHAAHALKGSAAAIGAKRLSGICLKIQKDCDNRVLEKIPGLLKEARGIFEETRNAVREYDFSKLES